MASKKRRASSAGRPGGSTPPPLQDQQPSLRASAMLGTLRFAALLSATAVALLVFEVLERPIGFWPALGVAFVAGIIARAGLVWLERAWLRAVARRAQRLAARREEQSKRVGG